MNQHRATANACTVAVLALAAAFVSLPLTAQGPPGEALRPDLSLGDRTSLGLTVGVAVPRGEFSEVAGVGFELKAHVLVVNRAGWLGLRVSGAGALHRAVSSPVAGVGRLSAGSRMATLDIGPQVMASGGQLRPYGFATLGLTFALTDPSIEGSVAFSQPPTYSDIAHLIKVGGGLYVPLTAGAQSISLDLGAHFRRNGDSRFLRGDGVILTQPGTLSLNPIYLSPELLVFSLGVAVGL